jgi:N-acetylmuramoyl-L-alanine amidase/Protein of unknown function (DUF2934)
MAATLAEEVRKRKVADALNGQDDEEDSSDVQNGEAAAGTLSDTGETDTLAEEEAIDQEAVSPVAEEKAPSLGYRFVPVSPPAQDVPQNVPQGTYPTIAEDQTGAPTTQIYTGPAEEGGQRYVIDQDTGQKIPYAEPATAEDKAAQPPPKGAVQLPKVDVTAPGEPAPDKLEQVERAELVKLPAEAPGQLTQVERGELVKVPTPPKVQPALGYKFVPVAPAVKPAQPVSTARTIDPGIELTPEKYKQITGREWMPGNIDPGINVTDQQYKQLTGRDRPKGDIDPGMTMSDDQFRRITGQNRAQPAPAVKPAEPAVPPVPTAEYTDRVQKWQAAMRAYGFDAKVKPDGTWTGIDAQGKEVTPEQNKGLYQFGARLSQQYGFSGQEQKLGQLGDAAPTAPAVKGAQAVVAPPKVQPAQPITTNPDGSDLPQRVQAVGNNDPAAFIVHHTSGRGTVDGVVSTLKERGLGVQYVMDRDGNIFQTGGPGAQNILAGWGPKGTGLNNQNIVGMEIIAKDDKDVTDAQKQSFARFIAARYPNTPLYGHGEVNPGHKEADEGLSAKAAALAYRNQLSSGQVPGMPGAAPQAQPVTKQANGLYQNEKPEDFLTGKVTTFATPEDLQSGADNGVGAPRLGKLDTTSVAGVAIPEEALRAKYGNNYAAWRKARVDVVDPQTGKRLRVPIVDLGPRGDLTAITDMTPTLSNYFGGDKNLMVKLVDNAGPDVTKNPQLFADEQAAIRQGFDSSTLQPGVQKIVPRLGYSFKPVVPSAEGAARQQADAFNQQNFRATIAQLPEADSGNLIGLYKRLDKPVATVPDSMRQEVQANLKPQIIAAMREKFPELKTDDEAWAKAQSDVGALDVGREWVTRALGYAQQFTNVMQKGVAGSDQLHVNQFLDAALPGASDADKHAYLTKLYAMPVDQRIQEVTSHLPQPQAGIPSTDPQQIVSALDRLSDPNFQKRQQADLDKATAEMKRNVSSDPRLVGTGMEKVVDATAQMPAFIAAFSNPIMMPVALAQVSDQVKETFRAQHPEWSEKELQDKSAYATLVQFYGMEAANWILRSGGGALLGAIEGRGARAIAQAIYGTAGQAAIAAGTQAATNIIGGQPIGQGVGEAALAGGIQGAVGGVVHGVGEFRGRPVAEERPPVEPVRPAEQAAPLPTEQPAVPVTQEDVARRAYELYEERTKNGQPGTALDDWAQAQEELGATAASGEPVLPASMGDSEPITSAIANRYRDQRIAQGELGPVEAAQGQSTEDMVMQGLQMGPKQRETLINNMMAGKGGNLDLQMSALRAKELYLSEASKAASRDAMAEPTNAAKQQAAQDALAALTDFHNGPLKEGKRIWSDSGRALQQEIPVDYTTLNGLKEAYLKFQGKSAPDTLDPVLSGMAKKAQEAANKERVVAKGLADGIGEYIAGSKLSTDDQVRAELAAIMKNLPCPT